MNLTSMRTCVWAVAPRIFSCFLPILVRGISLRPLERKKEPDVWAESRGACWNLTSQAALNASDSPGRRGGGTSASIHGLCARLDTHLSKTWYLLKPRWVSSDTGEWSEGEYALCHQTVGWYLMATFHIDQEQISSTLRSWQSAFSFFFLFFIFFLFFCFLTALFSLLACSFPCFPFPDASLCVLLNFSIEMIRNWILGTCKWSFSGSERAREAPSNKSLF